MKDEDASWRKLPILLTSIRYCGAKRENGSEAGPQQWIETLRVSKKIQWSQDFVPSHFTK